MYPNKAIGIVDMDPIINNMDVLEEVTTSYDFDINMLMHMRR